MRFALVAANGRVDNVIVVETGGGYTPPAGLTMIPDPNDDAEVDGTWDGTAFSPPSAPVVPVVFARLTRRQLRLWLLSQGVQSAQVEAAIATIADPIQREVAMIEWQDATTYDRAHPLVDTLGALLGFTTEQIDAGWQAAAAL